MEAILTTTAPKFSKGQSLTIKRRGASSNLRSYSGETLNVVRGGKNVTVADIAGIQFKVAAYELAASSRKQ